jgi:hypothetical protein
MIRAWIATSLLLATGAASAIAQAPNTRPPFSPYLNLNRRGTSPAINYYGLVRPQLTYNASIAQLQQSTQALQERQALVEPSELPPTGHVTGYLNHGRYFLNRGAATSLGSRAAAAPAAAPAPRRTR